MTAVVRGEVAQENALLFRGRSGFPAGSGRSIPPPRSVLRGSALRRFLPAAQPLFCVLFLSAGGVTERAVGLHAAVPLYSLAYLSGGIGAAVAAWTALRRSRVDVNFLMLLAAAGAASLGEWTIAMSQPPLRANWA